MSARPERREKCKAYLRRAGFRMPNAVALAKTEGFRATTSVWIGALGELLKERGNAVPQG